MRLKIILLTICFPLFLGGSCKKESNPNTNIFNSKWELEYIKIGNEKIEPSIDYILEFMNDNSFSMNLSVNTAGGTYTMEEENKITILDYSTLTEVCCESDFDDQLLNSFKKVETYNIDGKSLTFSSEDLYLQFKQR